MVKVRSAAVALSAVAAVVVFAGCEDKTTGDTETLKFTETDKGTHFAPIGSASEKSTPPGSGFALSIPLQDSSKKTVGRINATCIATQPSPGQRINGTCSGTADVPDGQLAINVGGEIGDNVSGAIVGGTGKYEGATGTFTSKSSGEGSKDTFDITLP
ncbi:MAG: hypothetical protein AABM29_08495 [Actinomycetota bacterium]